MKKIFLNKGFDELRGLMLTGVAFLFVMLFSTVSVSAQTATDASFSSVYTFSSSSVQPVTGNTPTVLGTNFLSKGDAINLLRTTLDNLRTANHRTPEAESLAGVKIAMYSQMLNSMQVNDSVETALVVGWGSAVEANSYLNSFYQVDVKPVFEEAVQKLTD